jgi:hypothetical protein
LAVLAVLQEQLVAVAHQVEAVQLASAVTVAQALLSLLRFRKESL